MTTNTFDVGSSLDRLVNDSRVRIWAGIAGALVIVISFIVVSVANEPSKSRHLKSVAVLPDAPLNIPIMRSWPYPDSRKVQSVRAPAARTTKRYSARR